MLTTEPTVGSLAEEERGDGALPRLGCLARVRQHIDVEAARAAVWPFLATRLLFWGIGVAAPLLFVTHAVRQQPTHVGWVQWDAQWFIATAQHGYPWKLFPRSPYSTVAFFPLYPLLIRLASAAGLRVDLAAMLIPNAAFLVALYYLYRLVRLDWPEPVAARTLWLLAVFPTAIVFFVPYTESLYLLCAVLTLWYLRRRRWLAAGIAGALGAVTRQSGIVLFLPYLVEWWIAYRGGQRPAPRGALPARAARRALLPALLMPLAVGAHLAYLWRVMGSPAAFLQVQRAWHRRLDWPWDGIVATVQRWGLPDQTGRQVHIVMELGTLALFLPLLVAGARRIPPSYTVYAIAVWLAALISPAIADTYWLPIMSSSRFALSVFPSFIVLAALLRQPAIYQAWLTVCAMALSVWSVYYVLGGWVA